MRNSQIVAQLRAWAARLSTTIAEYPQTFQGNIAREITAFAKTLEGGEGAPHSSVTVVASNDFNAGWLCYVLGLDRDETKGAAWLDGWDMGKETTGLDTTRYVFAKQRTLVHPQYVVAENA